MKKVLFLVLPICLLCLWACTPSVRKPYSFYQSADQIQAIEILQTDDRYTGMHVPARLIDSLPEESFIPLVDAFSAIDGSYSPLGDNYFGSYVIMIHYNDGARELLCFNGSIYQSANEEYKFSNYSFGTDEFYAILSKFSNIAIEQPN